MQAVGYIRVSRSRKRQGERYITKDVQREHIERYAAQRGFNLVAIYEEEDVSGKSMRRAGHLPKIVGMVERGEVQAVLVYRLNRFGRNQLEGMALVRDIDKAGGRVVDAEGGFDTADKQIRRFVLPNLLGIAEDELERYTANWDEAVRKAVGRGVHVAGTPAGYRRDPASRRLLVDPATGPVVAELFRRRAEGATLGECRRWVNERVNGGLRLPTSRGAASWEITSLKRLLANEVYLGVARMGKHRAEGAHEPLLDPVTFRRAQRKMPYNRRGGKAQVLLTGILRCSGCSYSMYPRWKTRDGFYEYRCRRRQSHNDCPMPTNMRADRVDAYVAEKFFEHLEGIQGEPVAAESSLADIRRRLELARDEQRHWAVNKRPAEVGGQEVYDDALAARAAEVEAIEREEEAELRRLARPPITVSARELRRDWEEGRIPLDEMRRLIALAVPAAFLRRSINNRWYDAEERVYLAFAPERPLLPRSGTGQDGPRGPITFRFPDASPS